MASDEQKHAWPVTVRTKIDLCPRCGGSHGEMEFRRFELGDQAATHWAYCPATGEPMLISLRKSKTGGPSKFRVRWQGSGRQAVQKPDPRYPEGIDVAAIPSDASPCCKVDLPYPAKEIGAWKVECTECMARVACTAAGRPDDPRSVSLPCRKRGDS